MLDDISLFISLVRLGSFKAVARQRQTHATTIRRRIDGLEKTLGYRLLTINAHNQIILSDNGEQLFQAFAEPIENLTHKLHDYQFDSAINGEITLIITPNLQKIILDHEFWQMVASYPNLRVNLFNHYYDEAGEIVNFDIGCSYHVPNVGHFIKQTIAKFKYGLYIAENYLEQHAPPTTITELKQRQHELIRYVYRGKFRVDELTLQDNLGNESKIIITNNKFGCKDLNDGVFLAKENSLIAILPIEHYPELIRIMPDHYVLFDLPIYFVQSSSLKSARKTLFLNFIKNKLK